MKLPRFSLRELFLLVALAAMGCGWWVDNGAKRQREKELIDKVIEARVQAFEMNMELTMADILLTDNGVSDASVP